MRWLQLVMGVVCMAMIANLQYGWTLFVDPIEAKYHWGRAAIQVAFTLFVLTETWLVPIEAWFVDKYGPRAMLLFGAILITIAWRASPALMLFCVNRPSWSTCTVWDRRTKTGSSTSQSIRR